MDKVLIYKHLKDSIKEKIDELSNSIKQVEESRNLETKSSVGDKYETGRAMAQNEIDRLHQQRNNVSEQLKLLNLISSEVKNDIASLGSLVETNHGIFYISVGYGPIEIQEEKVFCISPGSPLGREMMNMERGEVAVFNGREYEILNIE